MIEQIPSPTTNESLEIRFYVYTRQAALNTLVPLLTPHLPHSNPLHNRLQSPQNTPDRHCIYAATFPPPATPPYASCTSPTSGVPEVYTLIFADPSRPHESQIWLFNQLITSHPAPRSIEQAELLKKHMYSLILFLKTTELPDGVGWRVNPVMRFACVHQLLGKEIMTIAEEHVALVRSSKWRHWVVDYRSLLAKRRDGQGMHLDGMDTTDQFKDFTLDRVPEAQLGIVLETSSIPRQPSTLLGLPNIGLLNPQGRLVAWAYIGIDSSLATLYVLPEYRGRGLASYVTLQLLKRLEEGAFEDLGYGGKGEGTGWVHADVAEGNGGSEGVMRGIGRRAGWETWYVSVNSDKIRPCSAFRNDNCVP